MKLGTDNNIWDNIINKRCDIQLILTEKGLMRGICIKYDHDDITFSVVENKYDDLSTNYKKARIKSINTLKDKFNHKN